MAGGLTRLTRLAALVSLAACSAGTDGSSPATRANNRRAARDTALLDSMPACRTCRLVITDSLVVGSPRDSVVPARPPHLVRDARGYLYLAFHGWSNQPVLRYDPAGRLIGRLGRLGRGPAEYEMTQAVFAGPGDSLYVVDASRHIALFAPDGTPVRTLRRHDGARAAPVPFGVAPAAAAGEEPTVYALTRTVFGETPPYVVRMASARTDSFPLFAPVIRDVEGGVRMAVTDESGRLQRREPRLDTRAALAPDGSVWSYAAANYRLEQHDRDGTPRKRFGVSLGDDPPPVLDAAAFEALPVTVHDALLFGSVRKPGVRTRLTRARWVEVDSTGLLWVSSRVPAPGWDTIDTKAQRLSPLEAPLEETIPAEIEDRLYHTIVDVIDPARGELLVRHRLPFRALPVRAGFAGRLLTDDDGYFVPIVYRLELRR